MVANRIEEIEYEADGVRLKGCLARPAQTDTPHPGVLVVHEWWGITEHVRERARRLAALGYSALAVDMYGEGRTADDPEQAGALMNAVLGDVDTLTARIRAAFELLRGQAGVDPERVAAIGYCFGGGVVLHAARIGMPLAAVVSFHGSLGSLHRPEPGTIRAPILICHGGADEFVSAEALADFRKEMEAAGADYRVVVYDGALHGFTNPEATSNGEKYGLPLAYDERADRESWNDMCEFFGKVF